MFSSGDIYSFNVPEFGYFILNYYFLARFKYIRPSLALSPVYLLLSGLDSGIFLFVCVNKMGRDVSQTRNSQGPLQKQLCS